MSLIYCLSAMAAVALVGWFLSDRYVYRGLAIVVPNKMTHYSANTRTVFVVAERNIPGRKSILSAEVSLEQANAIEKMGANAKLSIAVSKRAFGALRVKILGL